VQFESEAQRALDVAVGTGASYADVRFGVNRDEHIEIRNGTVSALSDTETTGFSVRALVNGAWGFASSALIEDGEVDRVAKLATDVAKAKSFYESCSAGGWKTARWTAEFTTPPGAEIYATRENASAGYPLIPEYIKLSTNRRWNRMKITSSGRMTMKYAK